MSNTSTKTCLPTKLIDSNLARGNPVIVRIRFSSGATHFVVIAGKQGFDYLIRDPGAGASKGYYPLRDLGSNIEALRFYEPLLKPSPPLASPTLRDANSLLRLSAPPSTFYFRLSTTFYFSSNCEASAFASLLSAEKLVGSMKYRSIWSTSGPFASDSAFTFCHSGSAWKAAQFFSPS